MKINFIFRKKNLAYSIEGVFNNIIGSLPDNIKYKKTFMPYSGTNPFYMILNIIYTYRNRSEINHITGDINYCSLFLNKRNTLLTIHHFPDDPWYKTKLRKLIYLCFWYYLPLKKCKYVTCVSTKTKKDLLSKFKLNPNRVFVVFNPLNDIYEYSPKRMNTTKPIILQIGTSLSKNIYRLTIAIQGINCHLRIIGKLTKEQINELNRANIEYSYISDLNILNLVEEYKRCDILSFPSTLEGFGLPIIEAQAIGRPVLTSNIEPMTEIAGEGACFVDPYKAESIKEGIIKLLENSNFCEEIIFKGLENVKRFNKNLITSQYIKIYEKILEEYK